MKNLLKKINFKQPKYILPLIVLPFLIFLCYNISKFFKEEPAEKQGNLKLKI